MDKFLGLQYPIKRSTEGLMANKSGVDQIKADMLQLLLTNPGERVMIPEFGVPLRTLIFEPNDTTLEVNARNMIAKALDMWEPRVVVQQVTVTSKFDPNDLSPADTKEELGAILGIKIDFVDPGNIQNVDSLYLEKSIGG